MHMTSSTSVRWRSQELSVYHYWRFPAAELIQVDDLCIYRDDPMSSEDLNNRVVPGTRRTRLDHGGKFLRFAAA